MKARLVLSAFAVILTLLPPALRAADADGKLRIVVFGAHPDDAEYKAGGTAAKWARLGHHVKLVSATNGDLSDRPGSRQEVAALRTAEVAACACKLGVTSQVLDIHDGELVPDLETRKMVVRIIREWRTDIVIGHRPWDYHPDQRTYGPAAADMKAYWELLERTRMEFVAENPSPFRAFDVPQKYTGELFAKAQAHLDSAAAKLAAADEKYRRLLHFTRCGFEFAQLVVDTRAGMQQFEASNGKDEAAKARVLANWDRTVVMQKEFPPYAINWFATFHTPGSAPGGKRDKRGEGLHPKSPITPYTLKRMQAVGLE